MPKQKTHKGTSKVISKRKNDIKITRKAKGHLTGKKNAKFNRDKRKSSTLSSGDFKRLKDVI